MCKGMDEKDLAHPLCLVFAQLCMRLRMHACFPTTNTHPALEAETHETAGAGASVQNLVHSWMAILRRYYVRHHPKPKDRVALALVVKVSAAGRALGWMCGWQSGRGKECLRSEEAPCALISLLALITTPVSPQLSIRPALPRGINQALAHCTHADQIRNQGGCRWHSACACSLI